MKTTKSKIRCGGMLAILVLALGLTGEVANADFTFGTPTNLGPTVNGSYENADATLSTDGVELYFNSYNRPGGYGGYDIWVMMRASVSDPWAEPLNLGPTVNSAAWDHDPSISADGLSLFFTSLRPGGYGGYDIWVTTRATTDDPWGEPVNLGTTVNSSYAEADPSISAEGLSLYFCDYESFRPGGYGGGDLWVTSRATIKDAWGDPVNLGPLVNTGHNEYSPSISADGLALFFDSDRPGGYGNADLYLTTRPSTSHPWGPPVNLGPNVNSAYLERNASISFDGSTLCFDSYRRPGGYGPRDLWQVSIEPVVDFNGDEIVDIHDLLILIEHWGTDEPLCDIAPMPFGDGIVDVQDLEVLMSYWQQEVLPVSLLAYWKLDETEGPFALDSAGQHDGTLHREPLWQPTAGAVDGALEFDGIDDYVSTEFVLNPADGPFSVFAWIKGGADRQVVIAQKDGVNWLCTDSLEGNLMTELKGTGRNAAELLSQTIITDGDWHRIGFVCDGSHRTLYVDDVAVAEDAQTNLEGSNNGLYIGAGKTLDAGSFFSGLIDDIRIYGRAISP